MPRPNYPQPYIILTPGIISRIRNNQEHYDRDPELAERKQREQLEQRRMEFEEEQYYRE